MCWREEVLHEACAGGGGRGRHTRREFILRGGKTFSLSNSGAGGENESRGEYLGVPRTGEGLLACNSHCLLRNVEVDCCGW